MHTENTKASVIRAITAPLGFFALSLLTVEGFLGIVLIYSGLEQTSKQWGMFIGAGLFVLVVLIVSWLVANKPKNLTFGETSHLIEEGKIPWGESGETLTKEQVELQPKTEADEVIKE